MPTLYDAHGKVVRKRAQFGFVTSAPSAKAAKARKVEHNGPADTYAVGFEVVSNYGVDKDYCKDPREKQQV